MNPCPPNLEFLFGYFRKLRRSLCNIVQPSRTFIPCPSYSSPWIVVIAIVDLSNNFGPSLLPLPFAFLLCSLHINFPFYAQFLVILLLLGKFQSLLSLFF